MSATAASDCRRLCIALLYRGHGGKKTADRRTPYTTLGSRPVRARRRTGCFSIDSRGKLAGLARAAGDGHLSRERSSTEVERQGKRALARGAAGPGELHAGRVGGSGVRDAGDREGASQD